jgi:hypothetical protein
MFRAHLRHRRLQVARSASPGQALVELALVLPILLGIVAVLFQFGVIFVSFLSIVHETRDVGRWIAVHPDDKSDVDLEIMAKANAPQVINTSNLHLTVSPACPSPKPTHCPSRATAATVTLHMTYDVTSSLFLPSRIRWGFLQLQLPAMNAAYDYAVEVEPHS